MNDFKYQMSKPFFPGCEIPKILERFEGILSGEAMLSQSVNVADFECAFSEYIGGEFAVATSSCSAALEIALRCLDMVPGAEVIVPVETFIATGAAILREGFTPVFADISPNTFCLTLDAVKKNHTPKTKAVIVVHMAGFITPEIWDIKDYCQQHGLFLIEDAAHAPGASIDGIKAGNIGDFGCFSFYPTKIITTAEGGMLTTSNPEFYQLANSYRHRGRDMSTQIEQYDKLGINCRMSEFCAILGMSQLKYLDNFIKERNRVANLYHELLSEAAQQKYIEFLDVAPNVHNAYWRFIIRINDLLDRNDMKLYLAKKGVPIDWAYAPPLHLQPVFQKKLGTYQGQLPQTEAVLAQFICLPIHPFLSKIDVEDISNHLVSCIQEFIGVKKDLNV